MKIGDTMNNIEIRWLKAEDIEEVTHLVRDSFHDKSDAIPNGAIFLNDARSKGLVAVKGQEIVGFIWIDRQEDIFLQKKRFHLEDICVKENYRGMGIGKSLLTECARIAQKNDIDEITFTSSNYRIAAHALYRKLGYTIKDTTVFIKDMKEYRND